ncbi:VTT domain-containing protein [Actinotalea sp. K2]|uniref:DedA family protein n=1 Tax=Actinotalea sp. K2 TaxID=2939438 RepID=UPI002016FEDD|nr:VTT domain-containing protein [Actinotalea sp. K2]MCL3859445.1 VTT domain-containing protein [Actinotalea sp. K2]
MSPDLWVEWSLWAYPVVFVLVVLDGVFPAVPSEAVVTGLAALIHVEDGPQPAVLWFVAATGAWVGDQVAYSLGVLSLRARRSVPGMRGPRAAMVLERAGAALHERGVTALVTARFLPVVRVAVNVVAGAASFPRRRFMLVTAGTSAVWSIYVVGLGLGVAQLVEVPPMARAGVGVVAGLVIGTLLDAVVRARRSAVARRRPSSDRD